uniref:Store-operated calcium entry-associated regulatory factor n=1 Tax=Xenopus tropicalis TaxID=8364 RepID=SARAF_XENTR|nr:RecName: Full=Store-operated calcium entry-associated regulatory factor; Short=SARAF; Short=SOCE-associated regulatory factor; AltName: Full=Transmembrane protein 66; Flags: Precursor [Xenopus tropicalis]
MVEVANMWSLLLLPLLALLQIPGAWCWNHQERVLLRDIQAITLYADRYTNARRSAPVPQLKCIGGSAGCHTMVPQVVQCHNRGWDGFDVQWECKVDMDNSYRFGKVEVSCEGFDYPEDPYVLRGSCGLEYTLELTEEGRKRSQDGYRSGGFGSGYFQSNSNSWDTKTNGSSAIVLIVIVIIAYGVYKLFLSGPSVQEHPRPDEYGYDFQSQTRASAPPPPGFKSDFTDPHLCKIFGASKSFSSGYGTSHSNQGPGFWTGLGTGGVLGYLFGNRRAQPYQAPYFNTWTGPSNSDSMHQNYRPPQSSGVRTASGFGGTKRR